MQPVEFEREAARRLPSLLADLLDEESSSVVLQAARPDEGVDARLEIGGVTWLFELKNSSSPGVVLAAAERLKRASGDALAVLVVPHMTPGGARTAAERKINWIDLSGNADIRAEHLRLLVQGRPNRQRSLGRPATPFAPKSSRVARALLIDPERWWRQKQLSDHTDLDAGRISRIVSTLDSQQLLERDGTALRPRDPAALFDAWADDYRFDRHDIINGHVSGAGVELAHDVAERLDSAGIRYALTGLAAAWLYDGFARFRIVSLFVDGDPRDAADELKVRTGERGANVQLIGPDDHGVFDGVGAVEGVQCACLPQVLLDLDNAAERAGEAAEHLRAKAGWR